MLADLCVRRLVHDLSADMKLRVLRVKVEVFDTDFKREVHTRRGRRASFLGCGDSTDGAGAEEIAGSNEVVRMPLKTKRQLARWKDGV